jgi:hypothetical protein
VRRAAAVFLILAAFVGPTFLFAAWFMRLFGPTYSEAAVVNQVVAVFAAFTVPLWLAYRIWPWKRDAITIGGRSAGSL